MGNVKLNLTKVNKDESKYDNVSVCKFKHCLDSKPLISILIPTYDREDYLLESINSALNQANCEVEYEIIVVNDNPKNTSIELLLRNLKSNRISYYQNKENLKLFETMNLMMRLAEGTWAAFLHDDDLVNSNYIYEINRLLNRRKNIGAIMVSNKQIGLVPYRSRLRQSLIYKTLKPIKDKLSVGHFYRLRIFDNILWCADQYGPPSCGTIFRRSYFINLGGYNEDTWPSGDWYYMVEFNKHYKVYKTTEQLGQYRWGSNESMKRETIKAFIEDTLNLREYFRENYIFGKIMYHLTKKVHFKHVVDVFVGFDKTKILQPTDFNYIQSYPKNSLRYFMYLNLQRAYWIFRVLISLVIG
jgi:glycosyltransferase involved in cell wall biosynthesis